MNTASASRGRRPVPPRACHEEAQHDDRHRQDRQTTGREGWLFERGRVRVVRAKSGSVRRMARMPISGTIAVGMMVDCAITGIEQQLDERVRMRIASASPRLHREEENRSDKQRVEQYWLPPRHGGAVGGGSIVVIRPHRQFIAPAGRHPAAPSLPFPVARFPVARTLALS